MTAVVAARRTRDGVWAGAAILLVALNLRAAVIGIAPVLDALRVDPGMSASVAGLLVALPLLCFGIAASLGARIARRLGMNRTLAVTMLVLAVGVLIRLGQPVAALFLGTIVLGLAVGVANVVLPAVIKRDFPGPIGVMTGLYVTVMLGFGALAAATMVPAAELPGMTVRSALALWAIPALVAAAVWAVPRRSARRAQAASQPVGVEHVRGLWRDPLAWQVTGFMALQSMGYYAIAGWVPTLFTDNGLSAETGGLMLAIASMACIPGSLGAPIIAERMRTQHVVVTVSIAINVAGLLGILLAPTTLPALWMILMGLGQGATLSLALIFIGLRSPDSRHATQLSGMVQTVTYLVAAVGPLMVGALHELSGAWTLPVAVLIAFMVPQLLTGLGASRTRYVGGISPHAGAESSPVGR